MNVKKIILFLTLILFLVSVSAVSAETAADDNLTDIDNNIDEIILSTDDAIDVESTSDIEEVSSSDSGEIKVGEGDDIYAQTMYFDASVDVDGDGSRNSPFKYVTDARLPYGVTAYFANGVYEISSACDLFSNNGDSDNPSQVIFYGASTDGVIFKCINSSSVAFIVNDNSRFYAYNLTFDNAIVQNNGRFEAYGCVFKNGIAVDTTASYYPTRNNAFGGAIYSPGSNYYLGYGMKSYLTLQDCLFMNNSAVYGGSIYHKYGDTIIRNTKFYDSHASLYGGVLATDGGTIIIENCEFENCHAGADAGGAIYSKVTNLTVKNTNFSNGYGDFGGAICNLNSNLVIDNCKFNNNTAKYEGGAIYVMYGDVAIMNCEFANSSALDGGAIFEDNCTSITISKSSFDKSKSIRYGGTIFSNGKTVDLEDVTLGESTAPIGPVIYHQDKYDYDIGYNSDYQMMKYNSSYNGVLPSRYDLREEGYVTPVRDQEGGGNCWAFAGIAALESCIYKATGKSIDLSEENVKNLIELYSAYGWQMDTNDGGHSEMTWGNLISWLGPVLEEDDPYDDYSTLSTLMDAFMHVQNVYYLPARTSATDNDAIKKAIMDYGAVSVLMYSEFSNPLYWNSDTNAYFSWLKGAYANHAVTIVGWDDTYSKDNFAQKFYPDLGDGAWIVKNSWNTDWGDEGYFYVSYYDMVMCEVGEKNVAYTFILNDTQKYNRNYQYDIGGMTDFLYPTGNNQTLYYKNTFTAIGNDILTAASTIFEDATDYELSVYINDVFKHSQNGHAFAGYNTIPLTTEYQLNSGDKFTIQFKISKKGGASIPICEVVTATRLTYSEGISFFSTNGNTWNDLYTFTLDRPDIEHRYASQVACIKAFTRSSGITLKTTTEVANVDGNAGELIKITAIVKDENGKLVNNGFVTFDIDGKKESVKVINGNAVLETTINKEGTYTVKAEFSGDNYDSSNAQATLSIAKSTVKSSNLVASDVAYTFGEDNTIQATLTDIDGNAIFNADVTMTINNVPYTVKTDKNGVAKFNVNLAVGTYTAKFEFKGNDAFLKSSTYVLVDVKQSQQTVSDVVNVDYNYADDGSVSAIVTDEAGNPIRNNDINLIINGKTYSSKTDENGVAKFNIDLEKGEYQAKIEVPGKTVSQNSPKTVKVGYGKTTPVTTSSIEAKDTIRAENSAYDFEAKFYDKYGEVLADKEVQFIINGNDYFVKTNEYGIARLTLNLGVGTYEITIFNPATSEMLVRNASIVPRITGGSNLVIDYTYSGVYRVQVYGDNGQAVGAGENVVIKVGGKTFNAITNNKGFASVRISGLTPKTYTITAEYKGVTVSNKLVVKHLLKAKNKKYKRYKAKKYTATLKTSAGKAIKGKKITFKIKGKTYKAKTNKKGVASIKIKGLTKVGKYRITIKYLKSTIKKTITVKR